MNETPAKNKTGMKRMHILIACAAALIIIALTAALIATNARLKSMRITDYRETNLGEILAVEIAKMEIESTYSMGQRRSVRDEALLDELREIIERGCYQRTGRAVIGRNAGNYAFSAVYLTSADGKEFSIKAQGKTTYIATPYGNGWFFSNIQPGIQRIVNAAEKLLSENGE